MGAGRHRAGRYGAACRSLRYWLRLTRTHGSVIAALTGSDSVLANNHYPENDVIDSESGSQFYYHCHRGEEEHGHLHLFLPASPGAQLTHLIGISLDPRGLPLGLFTLNRWVANDAWLPAAETIALLERFHFPVPGPVKGPSPDPALGRWLTHFLLLYRPVVAALLLERDARLAELAQSASLEAALDDRALDIPSYRPIDWSADLDRIQAQLRPGISISSPG